MDNNDKFWLIKFEDPDHQDLLFTDEVAAKKTYDDCLNNWNCHLFEQISNNGKHIERYQYLRELELEIGAGSSGVFAGKIPENLVLNGIDLDKAVDTMIVKAIARKNEKCY